MAGIFFLLRHSWIFLFKMFNVWFQEPSNKRVKPVVKSNSLTGVITPVKTPALKRIGLSISVMLHRHTHTLAIQLAFGCSHTLLFPQRSISFRTEARALPPAHLRPRTKASSFARRCNSQCWSDTVESHDLTVKEIKRQEVRGGWSWSLTTLHVCLL